MIRLARILSIVVLAATSGLGQSANSGEIVPGDNLIVDGIPKIPASLAQEVNRYNNSRYASLAKLAPAEARDVDQHAIRRYAANPPTQISRRSAHAADFSNRCRLHGGLRAEEG